MKKQIQDMKFRVGSEQDSVAIQKLLFLMGFEWCYFGKNIQETNRPYLYAYRDTITFGAEYDLYEVHQNKETTLEDLAYIVGEYLYGDILGCQVNTTRGVVFITGVKVNIYGDVILIMKKDFDTLREYVNKSIEFFTNDYNDDTLLFEDFLKFIRSEEENTND